MIRLAAGSLCLCLLAGCAEDPARAPAASLLAAASLPAPTPETGPALSDPNGDLDRAPSRDSRLAFAASRAPHIYMAVQEAGVRENGRHPVSIVFAIDEARDGDLSDDPAIRITPDVSEDGNEDGSEEAGKCNPQVVQPHRFAAPFDAPVFAGAEVRAGVRADQIPAFMAIAASERLVALGLREDLAATRPWNVCTRKLWEAQLAHPVRQG